MADMHAQPEMKRMLCRRVTVIKRRLAVEVHRQNIVALVINEKVEYELKARFAAYCQCTLSISHRGSVIWIYL